MTLAAIVALFVVSFCVSQSSPKQDCRYIETGEIVTLNVGECASLEPDRWEGESLAPWESPVW